MALNNSNAATIDENVTSDNSNGASTVNAAAAAGATTTVGRKPNENLVVRIDENSDDNLQALFDSVLKPGVSKRPLQVPFRMRNLPNSFFNPPSVGSKSPLASHSRDDSGDSAIFGSGTTTICSPNGTSGADTAAAGGTTPSGVINPITSRLQAIHSRGHSCPASLQETYAGLNTHNAAAAVAAAAAAANNTALTQQQQQPNRSNQQQQAQTQAQAVPVASPIQPVHRTQRSYDVVSSLQLCEELGELPPGWEQTRTPDGAIYFLEWVHLLNPLLLSPFFFFFSLCIVL